VRLTPRHLEGVDVEAARLADLGEALAEGAVDQRQDARAARVADGGSMKPVADAVAMKTGRSVKKTTSRPAWSSFMSSLMPDPRWLIIGRVCAWSTSGWTSVGPGRKKRPPSGSPPTPEVDLLKIPSPPRVSGRSLRLKGLRSSGLFGGTTS
jgi:hypothetical protein